MRTETVKIYQFGELSDEAKQKVLESHYDWNVTFEWWDNVYEDAKNIGVEINSFDIDRPSYCNIEFMESAEATAHKIQKEHGEHCSTYSTAFNYLQDRDNLIESAPKDENGDFEDEYELDCSLDELDTEFKNELGEDYLKMLRDEYYYLTSEEAIIESIKANELEFTEDGKRY